jgi:hypothetical protein
MYLVKNANSDGDSAREVGNGHETLKARLRWRIRRARRMRVQRMGIQEQPVRTIKP